MFSVNTRRNKRERKGVLFVKTYQPSLKDAGRIINKNLYILSMKRVKVYSFTPASMISFRSRRKLSCYLVRPKFYPSERTIDSVQCKEKQCQTCRNVKETETFTSTTTVKTFTINHKPTYNDKYLVYLLTRNVCSKQDIGRAVEEIRYRCNSHKNNCGNYQKYRTSIQPHLFEHFSEKGRHSFL